MERAAAGVRRRGAVLGGAAGLALAGGRPGRAGAAPAPAPPAESPAGPLLARAELAPGLEVSRVVKGCWQLSGGHRGDARSDRTQGQKAVEDFGAFERAGVTAFDTADIYGPSEKLLGSYLKARGGTRGVQVLTKFCVFDQQEMRNAGSADFVRNRLKESTRKLGARPDLVQFYWHRYEIPNYVDCALRMAEARDAGQFGHVGLTNFDTDRVRAFVEAGVKPEVHQVQYSLLDRRVENGMSEYCQAQGITLLPYGVLAGGFLSEKYLGVEPRDVRQDTYSKDKYASIIRQSGGWSWFQVLLKELSLVAQKHDATIANVATAWVLGRPGVPAVLIGARNAEHVGDLAGLDALRLDAQDLKRIDEVLEEGRRPAGDFYTWERGLGKF